MHIILRYTLNNRTCLVPGTCSQKWVAVSGLGCGIHNQRGGHTRPRKCQRVDYSFYDLLQPWRLQVGICKGHLWKQKGDTSLQVEFFQYTSMTIVNKIQLHCKQCIFCILLQVFKGNSDSHGLRHSYLEHPVDARFVRIHVVDWHNHPSLRMELIGCQGNIKLYKVIHK